jgi:formate hydrogenlyase subunit 3/multisubunit Na+/H+ antiporter MnhD subunit
MLLFVILLIGLFAAIILAGEKYKSILALTGVVAIAVASSLVAPEALTGKVFVKTLYFGVIFGDVTFRVDGLSAWFILLSNFTLITGMLYGRKYLEKYKGESANLSLHYISYLLNQVALMGVFYAFHGLAFVCTWEIMALTAFIMVIFEHGKMETLKAGINYLIQSHISIVFLTLGIMWTYSVTGSFDFSAISTYSLSVKPETSILLFLIFFVGFAIKAGFVPFHTWLPHAHPAAPAHVSGIMSGVLIKTGIYGILRMLMLIRVDSLAIGYLILILSVITGMYGVLLAIVQHNLKRLLAYHSIENIGIIGIGIGIGAIGSALHRPWLSAAGYAGALLHTLNHSLFKSLLFFMAGNVYQATRSVTIDRMGGLIRQMPRTALLFVLAALAICGLPPFNGFISEFLIYFGLYDALSDTGISTVVLILAVVGLAVIGGLALLCFTKAFGIVFLGNRRHPDPKPVTEAAPSMLFPGYLIAIMIIAIGVFPQFFMSLLQTPVTELSGMITPLKVTGITTIMQHISLSAWGLIVITGVLWGIRRLLARRFTLASGPTWGCGYNTASPRLQYTASSFVRPYIKLIRPIISMNKESEGIKNILPDSFHMETHIQDRLESGLVDNPVRYLKGFLGRFRFLQNGSVQFYVLYGVAFIAISILIPLLIRAAGYLIQLLKP